MRIFSLTIMTLASATLMTATAAFARDTRVMIKFSEAMSTPDAKAKLGDDVKFYFGKQKHPEVEKELGEYVSNKKTNAVGKDDATACKWVFLSSAMHLQDRARKLGGNAIINVQSYYKKGTVENDKEFECGAGGIMAGVALKGTVVKLKK